MQELTRQALQLVQNREGGPEQWLRAMEALEDRFDEMTEDYRRKHLERMHRGQCSEEACILYSELLTDFERIGDHALNIAQSFAKIG